MTFLKSGIKSECYGCEACRNICPKGCIFMKEDEEGFHYPYIDRAKCIGCGNCIKVCPHRGSVLNSNRLNGPLVYAAINLDENIRLKSSSGGMFTLLSQVIIKNGGTVYGAGFDKNLNVIHKGVENLEELEGLRGSKYVQSYINNTYSEVERKLNDSNSVLFTGTPCQVYGLYSFLGKNHERLITADIICGGTPSPKVYRDYYEWMSKKFCDKIVDIFHRDKDNGWNNGYTCRVKFSNGIQYLAHSSKDPYLRGFSSGLFKRPSCHSCKFANDNRCSDITLGDYWKVSKFHPEMDDNKGTSLVILNTVKGRNLFDKCKERTSFVESNIEYAKSSQPCLISPCQPRDDRTEFFRELGSYHFEKVMKKFMAASPKVLRFFRRPVYYFKKYLAGFKIWRQHE